MTTSQAPSASPTTGMPEWAKKAIKIAVIAVVLVITYFILAAYLPRWWSQRVASLADGSFSAGIAWGVMFGLVCTLIPLLLFRAIWQVRKRKHAREMQIGALVLGVIFALPNLLTLSIVLGNSSAAHAGERVLDVDGPGFRGASVLGALIGVALFAGIFFLGYRYNKRGREISKLRSNAAQADSKPEAASPNSEK